MPSTFKITDILWTSYGKTFEQLEKEYEWIATDSNGLVYGYRFKQPRAGQIGFLGSVYASIAKVKYQGNWQDSLRRPPQCTD